MSKFITHFISSLLILCCISINQTWANCNYTFKQDVYTTSIHNGEVIYQAGFDNVYGLKTLTFKLTLTCVAAGKDLNYKIQYLPQSSNTWTDSNIKTSTLDGTWQAWQSESSETITYSPTTSDPIYHARGIRVVSTTDFGKSWRKDVYREVKVTDVAFEKATTFSVSTNTLEAFPATIINTTSPTTRSFTINYSNVENLSCTSDNSEFAVSSLSGDVCTGPQTVVVSFTPNSACPATRTATITATAGSQVQTISVSGEALLITPTLAVNSDMQNVDLYSTTFPENKLDLSTLITNHIGGELVYVVTDATNGGDISQATLEGNIFHATRSGDYQVIVTSKEDCSYSSATATLNIHVNDKVQPSFILNEDETLQEAYLNVETNTASIALSNVDVSTLKVTCDHDVLAYQLENNVITLTAKQAGETTISLEQPETPNTYSATRTFTFHITKNTATLTHNLLTDYKVDDEIAFTDLYTATNSEVEVSVLSSDEAVIKVEGDRLHAVGAGTATITISQAENYKWTALSTEQTVTVSKHANTIVWSFAGETTFSKTLGYDSGIYIDYHSDNQDQKGSPFTIKQTSGADIATYYENQKAIYTSHNTGTATWTISQPENYKYLAAEATITVTVAPQIANCYAVEDPDSHSIGWYSNSDGIEYTLNGIGETLSIEVWKENAATSEITIYGYNNSGNETTLATYSANSLSTSASTKTVALSEDIVKIKVKAGGTLNKYFRNLYITRKQVLSPSCEKTINLPTISLGNRSTQSFDLQWSTCADVIKLVSSNPHFSLDKTEISATAGAGTETITITYASDVLEENATSTITIYTPYQNITLTAVGTTERKKQNLSWAEEWQQANPTIRVGETITNAVTTSAESGSLPIYYYSDNEQVIKVSDDKLSFTAVAEGSATITAKQDGNNEWAPDSVKKTFTVSTKKLQYIVWEQDFAHLTTDSIGKSIPLTAKVQVLNDKEERIDADSRTALITYQVADERIASITEGNQLSLQAEGETTITASVPDDNTYEAATLTMRLIIRTATGCADPLVATYEGTIKILGQDQIGDVEMSEQPIAINRTGGFPDKVEFQYWGEDWKLVISYFKGKLRLEQSTDNAQSWKEVGTVEPKRNDVQTKELSLDPNVTHIRFVCPKGGQGYQCVKNIRVLPQQFIKVVSIGSDNTDEMPTINFGTLGVGSKETKTFSLSYSNIKSPLSLTTNVEDLTLSDNTMGYCGDWTSKSAPVTITFTPKSMGAFEDTIAIKDAKSGMSTSIRVIANVSESQQFVFSTPGDWGSAKNWNKGSVPGEEDVVSIGADVNIVGDVAVAGMTIFAGNTVNVKVNGKLTLGDQPSAEQEHYGNLVIENGGEVVLGDGVLKVNDFGLSAKLGGKANDNTDVPAQSGQIANVANLSVNGQAYFELALDPSGQCSYGWYDFTLPFPVDAKNGVWRWENGTLRKLIYDTNYRIMDNHEDLHAMGQYDWKKFMGTMQPGACYTITVDDVHNVYRFYKSDNTPITTQTSTTLQVTEGNDTQKGWNGIGNGTLQYANLSMDGLDKVQIYDHAANKYNSVLAEDYTFVVGSSFFVQVGTNGTIMNYLHPTTPRTLRAPKEDSADNKEFVLQILENTYVADVLYLSASDTATYAYQIGHDLLKMGSPADSRVACIWSVAYGHNLCDVELPLANNEATFDLRMFAPVAGEYTLHIPCQPANATLYLMQNGRIVHNLSLDDYTITLPQGVNSDYSLWMQVQPKHITTDVDAMGSSAVEPQKVLYHGHLYILHGGRTYTSTGNIIQ